jgi:hypothetical protein
MEAGSRKGQDLFAAIKEDELGQSPCVDDDYGARIVVSARA